MSLRIEHLTKRYRRGPVANDDVTLTVAEGTVYGLLGHNGAGKTTLLNQVAGLTRPTSGTIHLDGHDLVANPTLARQLCAMQPQAQLSLGAVSPRQVIEILGRIRGGDRGTVRARAEELLTALDMTAWADTTGEKLSGGIRRLTTFCMVAVRPARVVMLDEPTNDIDPVRRQLLRAEIRALADAGCAVVLVTHDVAEAERGVDRLAVLDRGRVLAEGTPAELRGGIAGELRLEVTLNGAGPPPVPAFATPVDGEARRQTFRVPAAAGGEAVAWAQAQRHHGAIEEFALAPVSLEDVYRQLVRHDDNQEETTDDRAA